MNPAGVVPLVGASVAIAGVMGAYLVLFPGARIVSLVQIFFFIPLDVPAWIYLIICFGGQFALSCDGGKIALEAHVSGFVFGLVIAFWLRPRLLRRVARLHRSAVPRRIRRR